MIDSHAHLFDSEFQDDLAEVLARARERGVERIVVPGTTRETSAAAIELADRYPGLYAAVGYHPHDAVRATDENLLAIEEMARHPKVVAVGEIGLDYYYDHAPREVQRRVFVSQLEMAVRLDLPVIVHTRDSMEEAIEAATGVVEKYRAWCHGAGPVSEARRGVFHCFTGDLAQAHRLFAAGFFVSFPGMVTFKKSSVAAIIKHLDLSRVLIETDSPYLTPVPFRGKRNEPSYLPLIAKRIAEILAVSVDAVDDQTTKNAEWLFRIEAVSTHSQEKAIHRV